MKVLLLSAYDAQSHMHWREQLLTYFSDWTWQQLVLPPRYFSWRQRGNSLTWAFKEREVLEQNYDMLLVTSMVDLSALRGFVPTLAKLPTVVYFHENQFAYPGSAQQQSPVEPQLTSIYSALCANAVVFNSEFNRQTFLAGARQLLKKLPDQMPTGLVDKLKNLSCVIPVPVFVPQVLAVNTPKAMTETIKETISETMTAGDTACPVAYDPDRYHIVWNHRWEYDKGPEQLLACIRECIKQWGSRSGCIGKPCFHIVGQAFRRQPKEFNIIKGVLSQAGMLGRWGFLENKGEYWDLLQASDAVLSTALHDFQGLSVLEATAMGCDALVPRRLVYPEWFGESSCYASNVECPEKEAQELWAVIMQSIKSWQEQRCPDSLGDTASEMMAKPHVVSSRDRAANIASAFSLKVLGPKYRDLFTQVVSNSST